MNPRKTSPHTKGSAESKGSRGAFADVLCVASPRMRPVCRALRKQIASIHPGFTEIVWLKFAIASFGVGPKKMTQHYAYIGVQRDHVNLGFYRGALLADPRGLLEGTGKGLRHVKVRDVATARGAAVRELLQESLAPILGRA